MKKRFIAFFFVVIDLFIAFPLDNYSTDEYVKEYYYEVDAAPYKEQHSTALKPAVIKIIYHPNFYPRPEARIIFLGKYANKSGFGAQESIKGEAMSTLRYALTEFSNQQGFKGSPRFYVRNDKISIEQKDERYKGWVHFEEHVEFYP